MTEKKRKSEMLAALTAKAAKCGSKATTIRGMAKAVLAATKTSDKIEAIERPRHWMYFARKTTRSVWRLAERKRRIIAQAMAKKTYRLPEQATEESRNILAVHRQFYETQKIQQTATSIIAKLREMYNLDGIALQLGSAWPLRKAESRWAGGEHGVVVSISDIAACSGESNKVWSDNGKWSGRNSFANLYVTLRALAHFPTLRTADGSIVLDAKLVGPREYRLTWVAQSTGFDIKPVEGWLVRGYHSTKKTLLAARTEAKFARERAATALLRKRQTTRPLKQIYVALEDSLRAGNCASQSESFATQIWSKIGAVGPCAVRADIVIGIRDDSYTRRAVGAALNHVTA